jgi:hypothetical protein
MAETFMMTEVEVVRAIIPYVTRKYGLQKSGLRLAVD